MPANIPSIRLTLEDGTDLAEKLGPRFLSATLSEKTGEESDQLDIVLHNHDGRLASPAAGVYLRLAMGWAQGSDVRVGLVDKGRFKVDEVSEEGPPDTVTIRCRAANLTGKYRTRQNKGWKNTTLGAILTEIARDNGRAAAIHPDLASKPIAAMEQPAKSDMAFVRDLGRRFDAMATEKDKTLIFMPIGAATTAAGTVIPALTFTRQHGNRWSFRHAQRNEHDGAEAQWHDKASGKRKTVKTGGTNRHRIKRTFHNQQDAEHATAAKASSQKRGAFEFEYDLALGDPAINPNQKATLQGWNDKIDAIRWLVKEATHKMDNSGLTTSLRFESAG